MTTRPADATRKAPATAGDHPVRRRRYSFFRQEDELDEALGVEVQLSRLLDPPGGQVFDQLVVRAHQIADILAALITLADSGHPIGILLHTRFAGANELLLHLR